MLYYYIIVEFISIIYFMITHMILENLNKEYGYFLWLLFSNKVI